MHVCCPATRAPAGGAVPPPGPPFSPFVKTCSVSQCMRPSRGTINPLVAPSTLPCSSPAWGRGWAGFGCTQLVLGATCERTRKRPATPVVAVSPAVRSSTVASSPSLQTIRYRGPRVLRLRLSPLRTGEHSGGLRAVLLHVLLQEGKHTQGRSPAHLLAASCCTSSTLSGPSPCCGDSRAAAARGAAALATQLSLPRRGRVLWPVAAAQVGRAEAVRCHTAGGAWQWRELRMRRGCIIGMPMGA